MTTKHPVYLVIDVESNGPSPRYNSMFAAAGVAICPQEKRVLGAFAYNFPEQEGTLPNDETMNGFWLKPENKPMYDSLHAVQVSRAQAATGITEFIRNLQATNVKLIFASDCSIYDWKFIDDLLQQHSGNYILGYSGMDIYSYVSGAVHCERDAVWPVLEELQARGFLWQDETVHDHDPYNDALHEAVLLADCMRTFNEKPWTALRMECEERPVNSYWVVNTSD